MINYDPDGGATQTVRGRRIYKDDDASSVLAYLHTPIPPSTARVVAGTETLTIEQWGCLTEDQGPLGLVAVAVIGEVRGHWLGVVREWHDPSVDRVLHRFLVRFSPYDSAGLRRRLATSGDEVRVTLPSARLY